MDRGGIPLGPDLNEETEKETRGMKKLNFHIEIKQVDNGFYLQVRNLTTYETTETVYLSTAEALAALGKVVGFVNAECLRLPPPTEGDPIPREENSEVPF